MLMRFSDGVTMNTDGPLRITRRHDGLYVVGEGMLMAIDTAEEGQEFIRKSNERKQQK